MRFAKIGQKMKYKISVVILFLVIFLFVGNLLALFWLKQRLESSASYFAHEKKEISSLKRKYNLLKKDSCEKLIKYANLLNSYDKFLTREKIKDFEKNLKQTVNILGYKLSDLILVNPPDHESEVTPVEIRLSLHGKPYRAFELLKNLAENHKIELKRVDFYPEKDLINIDLLLYTLSTHFKGELTEVKKQGLDLCPSIGKKKEAKKLYNLNFLWTSAKDKKENSFHPPIPVITLKEIKRYKKSTKFSVGAGTSQKPEFYKDFPLKVSGVICGPEKKIAVINGKTCEEGEKIENCIIVEGEEIEEIEEIEECIIVKITTSYVLMDCKGDPLYLPVQPR